MYRYHVWTFCNAFQHCAMTGENAKRKKGKMAWFLGRTDDVGWVIHNQRALLKVKKVVPRVHQSETFVRIHTRLYGWHPVTS